MRVLYLCVFLFQIIISNYIISTQEFPNRSELPEGRGKIFSCKGKSTGFYADIESNCRVYHTCDNHGNRFTYNCPQDTAFRQEALVCDHAHLVDCKKETAPDKLILNKSDNDEDNEDNLNKYSRSYSIKPAEPSRFLQSPITNSEKPTTFFMSSTVFLREHIKNNNRSEKLLFHGTTDKTTTTAGTEFPIPVFTGELGQIDNSNNNDPYYPKYSSQKINSYILKSKLSFTTKRPFITNISFKIPDKLPDLNSLDDLVDRKKLFFIPRSSKF